MRYGLIIAAGKQTRFKSDVPKALVKINKGCLLDLNIENLNKVCDKVYVVCSDENIEYFQNSGEYNLIAISSGLGCGDAVYKGLISLGLNKDDQVIVQWGDCYLESRIYEEMVKKYECGKVIVPVVEEENPYVQLIQNGNNLDVKFSKFGDYITSGFHDLSVFMSNGKYLLTNMRVFRNIYLKSDKYEHRHGNEYNFLDTFNDVDLYGKLVKIEDYKDVSFNTIEEADKIIL